MSCKWKKCCRSKCPETLTCTRSLSHSQQENIIREFNLNELYQKSKKLNKSKGDRGDKINESQFPPVPEEEEPEVDAQEEETETKKDK